VSERPAPEDHEAPLPAPQADANTEAPQRPQRAKRRVFLASIAVGTLGILTLAGWAVHGCTQRNGDPAAAATKADEPSPVPSASTSAVSSSASISPSAVPARVAPPSVAHVAGATRPKSFDSGAASAALDAMATKLADCKIPKGRTGRIRVVFSSTGAVSSATPLSPYAGTPEGACVAGHLKKAHVAPFSGPAAPYVYTFVIRR
jgi:hypothetical protein